MNIDTKKLLEIETQFEDIFKNENEEINIIQKENIEKIKDEKDIFVNDNNKLIVERLFACFKNKFIHNLDSMKIKYLKSGYEKLIENLPFSYIDYLMIIESSLNLNCLKRFKIINLDLSKTKIDDIEPICQLTTLKSLNLRDNYKISNLSKLKYAKFEDLEELNLSNCGLRDLNSIGMGEYKFPNLTRLDLSCNHLKQDLKPITTAFKHLKYLNIRYNNIIEFQVLHQVTGFYPITTQIQHDDLWALGTHIK